MGNLISRPSCLGQKSKHVRSDEDFLKECYQRKKEWQPAEQHGEGKKEEAFKDKTKDDASKEREVESYNEPQEIDLKREQGAQTPISDKPLRSSPASTIRSTSTLENAWHSSPSPIKTSRNGTLTRRTVPPEFARSPLTHSDKTAAERRASFQRRDSREGSPWSWKTVASREVTEVTEVTETTVTEIVEVTEYPPGDKGGNPIVTRTVRVLNGVAEELAEVEKKTFKYVELYLVFISLSPLIILSYNSLCFQKQYYWPFIASITWWWWSFYELIWSDATLGLSLLCSSKVQAQTKIPAWINGG